MALPTFVDETDIEVNQYWSCPIRFVPDSVWSFAKMFKFYENHPNSKFPEYRKVSQRYLQAESIIHSELVNVKKSLS